MMFSELGGRNLLSLFNGFFSWAASVYKRLFYITPYLLSVSVVCSLVAQMSMVVSFFLPLKIVYLLGSGTTPHYFLSFMPDASLYEFIAMLVVLSVMFYMLFWGASHYSEACSSKGASKVVLATSKLTLFSNQEEVSGRSYLRFSNFLAAVVFLLFSLMFFGFFYIRFLTAFLAVGAVLFFLVTILLRCSDLFHKRVVEAVSPLVTQIYGCYFLVLFSWMVFDISYYSSVSVYVALACLLLVRQLFQRMTTATIDAVLLYRDKVKISSLFFKHYSSVESAEAAAGSVIDICLEENIVACAKHAYYIASGGVDDKFRYGELERNPDISVLQSSIVDVVMFSSNHDQETILVKAYSERQKLLSMRETDLLYSLDSRFPSLELVAIDSFKGFKIHIYRILGSNENECSDFAKKRTLLRCELLGIRPPEDYLKKYLRSHSLLARRVFLWRDVLSISVFSENFQRFSLDEVLNKSSEYLSDLPMSITTGDVTPDSLRMISESEVVCLHWERWSIEPVGFGYVAPELEISHLEFLVGESGVSGIDPLKMRLCGLLSILEVQIKSQKLLAARDNLALIVSCIEEIEDIGESSLGVNFTSR